jgi:pimeloyl-ACP methyl ester carboxylesterase
MYVMDYGAPIGYRLALLHPERIQGLIVQNGNAYEEGLLKFWDPIKKYWADPTPENRAALYFLSDRKSTGGSTKPAWRILRCWTRPPGWWIKWAWIAREISISRWT